jgi:hypothetical protein
MSSQNESLASRIVLILDRFRPERYAFVRHHERHFLGVVHIVGQPEWRACLQLGCSNASAECGHGADRKGCPLCGQVSCKLQYREFYPGESHLYGVGLVMLAIAGRLGRTRKRQRAEGWLPTLERRARRPLSTCTGVLMMHMDFWLAPGGLETLGLRADRVWRLGPGLHAKWWHHASRLTMQAAVSSWWNEDDGPVAKRRDPAFHTPAAVARAVGAGQLRFAAARKRGGLMAPPRLLVTNATALAALRGALPEHTAHLGAGMAFNEHELSVRRRHAVRRRPLLQRRGGSHGGALPP